MEMEEKRNPNSWSELPQDLVTSVFERLSFANFQRAKSVCTSWYFSSRQSVPKNQIPWLILFPEDDDDNNKKSSCTLFNLEEKDKLYKTKDLGFEFAKSVYLATYGNWLLMRDPMYNLYIVNLFTKEMINLPPVESQLGEVKVERTKNDRFRISNQREWKGIDIRNPVFWIDEKTKDYVVIWALVALSVVYAKKGDALWKQIPELSLCNDMVYKDHKLYFLNYCDTFKIKIFDFSGEILQQTFQGGKLLCSFDLGPHNRPGPGDSWSFAGTKLVVTVTGDVLMVDRRSWIRSRSRLLSFHVYKVYSSGVFKKYEQVDSLGDETVLWDLGITMLANDNDGFKRNCIYFNIGPYQKKTNEMCLFNLETQKMEPLHKFDCSPQQLARARWFLPSFERK